MTLSDLLEELVSINSSIYLTDPLSRQIRIVNHHNDTYSVEFGDETVVSKVSLQEASDVALGFDLDKWRSNHLQ